MMIIRCCFSNLMQTLTICEASQISIGIFDNLMLVLVDGFVDTIVVI